MIIEVITALVAGAIQLAQQAGQSIQQWINSPAGQQFIQNCIQQVGPDGLRIILEKLGIKL